MQLYLSQLKQKNIKVMKKLFAVISMVAFFAAVSVPAFAVNDEKPKAKKECAEKAEVKKSCASACSAAQKPGCDKDKK